MSEAISRFLTRILAGQRALLARWWAWALTGDAEESTPGWKGRLQRLAGSAAAGFFLGGILIAAPLLRWIAVLGWCVAAWRSTAATPRLPKPAPARSGPPTPEGHRQIIARWIDSVIGPDRQAVHLGELWEAFRECDPSLAGWSDTQLRRKLDALDIPVRKQVRSGEATGKAGVHRADLRVDPSPAAPAPSEGVEAGQRAVGPAVGGSVVEDRTFVEHA